MIDPNGFQSIVVLTGAGISAESGIRTFRDADGLWEEHAIEEVASPDGFRRDPELVHRFYNLRRQQLLNEVEPNDAHRALVEFQQRFPGDFTLVTQNVDNLHEQAGSTGALHMHGELLKVHCQESGQEFDCRGDITPRTPCECCGRPGALRPHIVWFGEMPHCMVEIQHALRRCDLFVAIGTSGNVYPAAGFVDTARAAGAATVELNLEPSEVASSFDYQIYGPATQVVPGFFLGRNETDAAP
ncbi:NAD-dependent protein deacylase [Posidoniimonas polymericola]|uniref:NAD-dependent protein deacylase n=1 Tax=Posidoniimonas polymericola TaxID=2528002 RepID=A0A5C5XQ94_9BACT|nr:Sir2 family NAD+-dependent deacetylase [Posidoniimonas polymericola]TWT65396.1 NAD-dependent protein deacylase [Posidoniimonas polymericola]